MSIIVRRRILSDRPIYLKWMGSEIPIRVASNQCKNRIKYDMSNFESQTKSLCGELLKLYDELTALNACGAFIMQALATAQINGGELDERSATGGVFCAQWVNERTAEMEQHLKDIVARAYGSATVGGS